MSVTRNPTAYHWYVVLVWFDGELKDMNGVVAAKTNGDAEFLLQRHAARNAGFDSWEHAHQCHATPVLRSSFQGRDSWVIHPDYLPPLVQIDANQKTSETP